MTETDTRLARGAEAFGCGGGLDLLERLAVVPEGMGTGEVSEILGLASHKGIGSRLRTTKFEIARSGIRFEHAVIRTRDRREQARSGGRARASTMRCMYLDE